jgi:peroxiredoxin
VVVRDTRDSALAFVAELGMTYDVLWDPDQTLARDLGLVGNFGLPQTFFIGPDGDLAGRLHGDTIGNEGRTAVLGAISEQELDDQIRAMLDEQ